MAKSPSYIKEKPRWTTTVKSVVKGFVLSQHRSISSVQRGKFCFNCDKKSIFKKSRREEFYKGSFAATFLFSSSDRLTIGSCSSRITGRLLSLVRYESHLKLKVGSFEKKSRIVRTWHWETRGSGADTCKRQSAGCFFSFSPCSSHSSLLDLGIWEKFNLYVHFHRISGC